MKSSLKLLPSMGFPTDRGSWAYCHPKSPCVKLQHKPDAQVLKLRIGLVRCSKLQLQALEIAITGVCLKKAKKKTLSGATVPKLFATCARGLEGVLVDELRALGAAEVTPGRGGVHFLGDLPLLYQANLWLRT